MANYLVAGAAGFIGAKVSEFLLADGHIVVGIDSINDAYGVQVKQARLAQLQKSKGFEFYASQASGDMDALLMRVMKNHSVDAVFNLAVIENASYALNLREIVDRNIVGTFGLLQLCVEKGVSKFIQASSLSVYGTTPAVLPIPETYGADRLKQLDAVTLRSAEELAYSFHMNYDIDVAVFRYFNNYGPGDWSESLVFKLCELISEGKAVMIFGDGTQSQGLSYVDDVAQGTVQGLKSRGYQEYNLGGHELVTMNRLIELIENNLGKKAKLEYLSRDLSVATTQYPDLRKSKKMLLWEPKISLEVGIKNMVDWYIREKQF